ncbi:hypothetical protein ACWD01_05730 [Streptomyces sp. NPDC002835]|jgi:uncharacterized membrane protein
MSGPKEDEVRRMMDTVHPAVPADLGPRAVALGARLLRRSRIVRRVWLLLLVAAVIACSVWAAVAEPWAVPPTDTTPPLDGW